MTDVFIPPPGAMQFELTNDYEGKPRTGVLWVRPVERLDYEQPCQCKTVFRVIDYSDLPEGHRRLLDGQRNAHTCACIGRIVE